MRASSRINIISEGLLKNEESECWIIYLRESPPRRCRIKNRKENKRFPDEKAVKTLKDAEIQILGSFILEFPDETLPGFYSNHNGSICYECSISRSILASIFGSFLKPLLTSISPISFRFGPLQPLPIIGGNAPPSPHLLSLFSPKSDAP